MFITLSQVPCLVILECEKLIQDAHSVDTGESTNNASRFIMSGSDLPLQIKKKQSSIEKSNPPYAL